MRALLQRVSRAEVSIEGASLSRIDAGLVILVGIHSHDTEKEVELLANKLANLRIFSDSEGKMNLSLLDTQGEALVVSQFTLYGDCRGGRRPSFTEAASPEQANRLYLQMVETLKDLGIKVQTGQFQAHMQVELVNDGPVTLMLDSASL